MMSTNKTLFYVNLHTGRLRYPSPSVDVVIATASDDTVGNTLGSALACTTLQQCSGALVRGRTSRVHVRVVWSGVWETKKPMVQTFLFCTCAHALRCKHCA